MVIAKIKDEISTWSLAGAKHLANLRPLWEGFGVFQLHYCSAPCGYCSTPEPAPVKLRFGSSTGSTSFVVHFGLRYSFRLLATV